MDNAATSWPKPPAVCDAVDHYLRQNGAAFGRGATRRGAEIHRTIERCRSRIARFWNAESPERILFTFNGTDSLNLALHGILRTGDHVVTTEIEHNSVLRPLRWLQDRGTIDVTFVPPDPEGVVQAENLADAIQKTTRLLVLSHVSNVTGAIQPVADVCQLARRSGVKTLIDAAQSAGHLPIDVSEWEADLVASSGHKGLLGPLGTGLLYVRPGVEEILEPLRQGGTGTLSEEDRQPGSLPDKYESGNHNVPGLIGLEAATDWLETEGLTAIQERLDQATDYLWTHLRDLPGVQLFGPADRRRRCGVVSFQLEQFAPQEAAAILDEHFGIEVRAGLHCSPRMHQALGTMAGGGTIRLSPGPFTTQQELEQVVSALQEITASH